jgi:hypothetical protein
MFARLFAAALLAGGSSFAAAQGCRLPGPATPAPAWVSGRGAATDDALYAAGVADMQRDTTLDTARDAARTRALAELAQQVQADISSRITDSLEKVTQGGRSRTSETFSSVGAVQSQLVLRSAQIVEQWSDASACRLWVRVRMPRNEAELARRVATSDAAVTALRARLQSAGDNALPLAQREAALAEAVELAKLADPALSTGFSRDGVELQRMELAATLTTQRQRENSYREGVTQHVQAMGRAAGATATGDRRLAQQQALSALEGAVTAAPQGVAGFTLPFVVEERLATLYADLGKTCTGRQWFERRNLPVPAQLSGTPCDSKALAREKRLQYLAGKTLQVDCSLRLAGQQAAWPKACGTVQTQLAGEGAVVAARGATAQLRIELQADGTVEERRDPESGNTNWRFRGKIRSTVQGPDAVEILDEYEGLTGWNNVSASMAGDLLALAVTRRLDTALNAFWEK